MPVAEIFLREAHLANRRPEDETGVQGIVKRESKQHAPIIGAYLVDGPSRQEAEDDCQGREWDRHGAPSNKFGPSRADTLNYHVEHC